MIDQFASHTNYAGRISNALAVTPNDTEDLPFVPSVIWMNTPGNLRVTFLNDETVTLNYSSQGANGLTLAVKRIHATGTTAADIILMW